ncbi:cation transporter [Caulobacter endophyticus]|uniref:Cation transporter n=1 Tax=Caulobacter endophyticus TaxID=2172652 RepID=A0A2T9JY28_9CAUL|nr:cation transporter [Caulobacter endophyticus]
MFPDLDPAPYILGLTGAGVLIALVAWLPLVLRRLPISLPIICIALGAALFSFAPIDLRPLPSRHMAFTERFAEFVVIIALMGAGLKIDRVFHVRRWQVAWRLLGVTMPLSIAAITALGVLTGMPWVAALLLGAALAPTDPVLASDVQVGPPKSGEEDEVRFGLTSEAGLNDGLAFPFVHLAIVLAAAAGTGQPWVADWLTHNVLWEIGAGVIGGWLVGWAFGWLTFRIPSESKLAATGDGLIAIAATFLSYGLTELINCYGFLAVFVTALTLRHAHREHEFQRQMHDVTEQIERLAMMVLLLLFGGALVSGILAPLSWTDVGLAVAILLVIRPVAGLIGLVGFRAVRSEKLTLAFFGIRGVGTIYYLAYALGRSDFPQAERLWAIAALVILLSIIGHGLTVTPIMRRLDRSQGRDPDAADRQNVPPPGLKGPAS